MGYSITQTQPSDDQEELISLINRNFDKNDSQWFNWSHRQNPFGENYCWLAREEAAGKLIGSTGLLSRRMNYDGEPFNVGQAEAINIDPEHRSAQAAIKLQRALVSHLPETDFKFVYGMTETAAAVFQRCRYKKIGTFQHWVKPLRSEYKFKEKFSNPILRRGAAACVDLGLRLYSLESRTFLSHRLKTNFDAPFDERFHQLFKEYSHNLVMVERTREFLEWRFCQEPTSRFQIMTLENRDQKLLGYLVYVLGETGRNGDHAAGIQDFFYRDQAALKQMLAAFSQHCRQIGMDTIVMNYFGRKEIGDLLSRFGFFERKSPIQVFVHQNPQFSDFQLDTVLDADHWHLTNAELLS
ncbi:hypothetical protein Enr10x_52090 [Gimesia panareensis]|uniref:N-acetyltransferase domain-containing protein n=1 Tax=Gimesia panareensis TaxID=2527978 RepID=A0A517QDY7_9PLAN|nr:GNAT family N-acetyltransferase [Gimesia panareensis]QDT29853.1 hypothetical protein Enr10x_52090 [Gimesia panareensis]